MNSLYDFQKTAVSQLMSGKHIIISGVGSGKTAMALTWVAQKCRETGKDKVLVVTTASKSRTGDFEQEAGVWCPTLLQSLSSFSVLSWHKLRAWVNANWRSLDEYVYVFDELQRCAAGVSSGMGRAFLKIGAHTNDWAGFTGTPGDTWLKFYPYFQACGKVKNKTQFLNEYASVQTYKGYPEIVGWRNESRLKEMWAEISYAPDTQKVMSELPEQTHKVFTFKKPSKYDRVCKTRYTEDEVFLDTPGALCAELRRQCFTKDKQEWIKDFVDGLESGAHDPEALINIVGNNEYKDIQYKRADDIVIGDAVLSANGKTINHVVKKWEVRKELYDIKTSIGNFRYTSDHPLLVARNRDRRNPNRNKYEAPTFIRVSELKPTDRIVVSDGEVFGDRQRLTQDEAFIYGMWLGDGSVVKNTKGSRIYRIHIGYNQRKKQAIEKVLTNLPWCTLKERAGNGWFLYIPRWTSVGSHIKSSPLIDVLDLSGEKSYGKRIISGLTKQEFQAVLDGHVCSDGHVWDENKYPNRHGQGILYSCNKSLLLGVQRYAMGLGYFASIRKQNKAKPHCLNGRIVEEKRPQYKMYFNKEPRDYIFKHIRGRTTVGVQNISRTEGAQRVIHFEVSGDHTYYAENIAVHNCVFFYNFIKTGDNLEEIMQKVLPKDAKIWRIDGKHHDIPTAETIGPKDMVLCQWQSGSEALNLHFLHYWVAVELCYSYSTANQARGRIRRIGQKHPQWYGYLLTEGTIEQDILKCLKGKGEFASKIWCAEKGISFSE